MKAFRVLLVDDEEEFVGTLVRRLRKRKLDVQAITSGREAVEFVKRQDVEVVVLDVKMPDMDGITTLKEIKKIKPDVEVIMLTGHASMEAAMEGMESGAFDYLMKPIEIDELLYKLQDAFRKKWCRDERERCVLPSALEVR
ncbi:MAG: response regulator [Thermodesulfobacteriota bacterium]